MKDKGAWRAAVHTVAKSRTQLSGLTTNSEKGSVIFSSLPKGSKAQNKRLGLRDRGISKEALCAAVLGFQVSISQGPYHEHNYEIKFAERIAFFFQSGNTSRPRQPFQTPGLPTECARMTLERFQKSNPPPAFIPFFPPTDVAGLVRKLLVCVTLKALMAFLGRDKSFWVPSITPLPARGSPSLGSEDGVLL